MSAYTLFIDESGDFNPKGRRKTWFVGGLLVAQNQRAVADTLGPAINDILKPLPHEPWFCQLSNEVERDPGRFSKHLVALCTGDLAWNHLHRTELIPRQYQNAKSTEHLAGVNNLVQRVLAATLHVFPRARFVAAKTCKLALSDRLANYRAMLVDLISTMAVCLSDQEKLDALELQLSNICWDRLDEFGDEIEGDRFWPLDRIEPGIDSWLQLLCENGLASRGVLSFVDQTGSLVNVRPNEQHPGLVVSDLILGTFANSAESEAAAVMGRFGNSHVIIFDAFGNLDERRAKIALRDGDPVGAVVLFSLLESSDESMIHAYLHEALAKITQDRRALTGRYAIEEIIERLDRQQDRLGTERILKALQRLESALADVLACDPLETQGQPHAQPELLFRLRSYMLVQANHLGQELLAGRLKEALSGSKQLVALNPVDFNSILRFQVAECESEINSLNFTRGLESAIEHYDLVSSYGDIWEMLSDSRSSVTRDGFESSHLYQRAVANALRCATYATMPGGVFPSRSPLREIQPGQDARIVFSLIIRDAQVALGVEDDELTNQNPQAHAADDRGRLRIIISIANSRLSDPSGFNGALKNEMAHYAEFSTKQGVVGAVIGEYHDASALRTAVNSLLLGDLPEENAVRFVADLVRRQSINAVRAAKALRRHPQELIARDAALLFHLLGHKHKARSPELLELCRHFLRGRCHDAPVFAWLLLLNEATGAFIRGSSQEFHVIRDKLAKANAPENSIAKCEELYQVAMNADLSHLGSLRPDHSLLRLRLVSPY